MDTYKQAMLNHIPSLRRYSRALTGNIEHGDALVRKTLDCANSLINFLPKEMTIPVWLYSVMHNLALEFFGQLHDDVTVNSILPYVNIDDLNNEQDDSQFDIKGALAHLTIEEKETVLLASLEQLAYADICKVMGYNEAKLVSCLDNARTKMCEYLFDEQFDDFKKAQ